MKRENIVFAIYSLADKAVQNLYPPETNTIACNQSRQIIDKAILEIANLAREYLEDHPE